MRLGEADEIFHFGHIAKGTLVMMVRMVEWMDVLGFSPVLVRPILCCKMCYNQKILPYAVLQKKNFLQRFFVVTVRFCHELKLLKLLKTHAEGCGV